MTTFVINSNAEEPALLDYIAGIQCPYTVHITQGRDRSLDQNRLAFMLYKEIAQHFGDRTPEDVRTQCKLEVGIPILRHDLPEFRDTYDKWLKPLSYHAKIEFIERMDLGVTRLMTVKQMTQYLNEIYRRYSEQGCALTSPESERP